MDNGSGVAAMLGSPSTSPRSRKAQRRRTITFMAPIGHHVTPDLSLQKLHDNRATVFAENGADHQRRARHDDADLSVRERCCASRTPRRRTGSSSAAAALAQILVDNFRLFGVALYELPSTRFGVAGDLTKLTEDAPGIEVIESNAFYHSDEDKPDVVPAAGLESITRAYAKIIDDINKLDLKDIVDRAGGVDGGSGKGDGRRHDQGDRAVFNVEGLHKLWSFRSQIEIPLAHITGVEADPDQVGVWWHGFKLIGTDVRACSRPARSTTTASSSSGTSTTRRTVIVSLEHERYKKLIIEVSDVADTVARLHAPPRVVTSARLAISIGPGSASLTYCAICAPVANQTPGFDFM